MGAASGGAIAPSGQAHLCGSGFPVSSEASIEAGKRLPRWPFGREPFRERNMPCRIREATPAETSRLVEIIRNSFQEVAVRFGLTEANCPKHPSNCQDDWITSAMAKGVRYFVLEDEDGSSGCVALEQATVEVCFLERLAVLPSRRRRGYGRALVDRVLAEAREGGAQRVEIGVIAAQMELRDWYRKIGFSDQRTTSFPHLPFDVLFMSLNLQAPGFGGSKSCDAPRETPRSRVLQ